MNKSQKTLMGKYYSGCCAIILLSMVLEDRKSTRLNSSHKVQSRMPSSA